MAIALLPYEGEMLDSKIVHLWRGRSHPDRCPCCRKRDTQEHRERLAAVFHSRKYQQFANDMPDDPWTAALKAVFTKAATDADFRAKCLTDATAAIKEVSGLDVVGINFTDSEEGDGVPLPAFGSDPDEIRDLQSLDRVSGGATVFSAPFGT